MVRRIFAEAAAGRTLRRIGLDLIADGIPTSSGKAVWFSATLITILSNESDTGKAVAFKRRDIRTPGKPTKRIHLPPEEQVPLPDGVVPRLIDPVTFATVRQRLARNKAESVRNNRDPEATLLRSGFIFCAACGTALRVACASNRSPSYVHDDDVRLLHGCQCLRIGAGDADGEAWRHVERIMTRRDLIRREIARRLADLTTRQAKIARAIAALDDEIASAPLVADARQLAAERRDLAAERADVAARADAWHADLTRLDDFSEWSATVAGNLATMTYQERRDLMTALGLRAVVYRAGERTPRVEITTDLGPLLYDTSR